MKQYGGTKMKKKVITDNEVDRIVKSEEISDDNVEKLVDWVLQVKEEIENERLEENKVDK